MPRPASSAFTLSDPDPAVGLARLLGGGLLQGDANLVGSPPRPGLNFATEDPLCLGAHPAVRAAARAAHWRDGTPEADTSMTQSRRLERRIAAELKLSDALTFASGTDAIHQTLFAILRPGDEVLVDSSADSAMFETVSTAKAHLHRFPSASVSAVERRLRRLARQPRQGRLVIAVPAMSAHGSRMSDIAELTQIARQHGALLIVDVSQDFGAMGPDGCGVIELQNCLGRVDIVLGSFARCFGADGGFAAFRDPGLKPTLQQAAPLSPVAASAILAAVEIAFGPEGRRLRRCLQGLSLRFRNHLLADGSRVLGSAAPQVPILLPPQTALPRTALLESAGPKVRLLMAPTVPLHAPRWRIELTALHGLADIDDLAELIRDVSRAFDRVPSRPRVPA